MPNNNNNCLEGMECPACQSSGPFRIRATVLVTMHDDGTGEDLSGSEFDKSAYCQCDECEEEGTVGSFTYSDDEIDMAQLAMVDDDDTPSLDVTQDHAWKGNQ